MTDAPDSAIRLLAVVSKLLAKLSVEDLDRLLAGESKLAAVPQSWRPTSKRDAATPVTLPADTESVRAALDSVSDRGSGINYVKSLGMTVRQLQKLARELGVQASSKLKKEPLIEAIVNSVTGSRLSSDAIRGGDW